MTAEEMRQLKPNQVITFTTSTDKCVRLRLTGLPTRLQVLDTSFASDEWLVTGYRLTTRRGYIDGRFHGRKSHIVCESAVKLVC